MGCYINYSNESKIFFKCRGGGGAVAVLPSGLERWSGERVVLGLNLAAATSLRNFGNSVYPALPVSFGGDTKSRRPLLCGVYARGSKRFHQSAPEMCNLSWTSPFLEKDNSKNNPGLCVYSNLSALQYRKERKVL